MSRIDHAKEDPISGLDEEDEFSQVTRVHHLQQYLNYVKAIHLPHQPAHLPPRWSVTHWQEAQQADPGLKWVMNYLIRNTHVPPGKATKPSAEDAVLQGPYAQWLEKNYESLAFDTNGILCFKIKDEEEGDTNDAASPQERYLKLVAEADQVPALIRSHEAAAHTSSSNVVKYCRMGGIHFPNMRLKATAVVRSCFSCQTSKGCPKPQKGIYRSTHRGFPWDVLNLGK